MNKPFVPERLEPPLAEVGVSVSDLKKNPASVIAEAKVRQVAILNRGKPVAYVISPEAWEAAIEILEEWEDARLVKERLAKPGKRIRVELDDLV